MSSAPARMFAAAAALLLVGCTAAAPEGTTRSAGAPAETVPPAPGPGSTTWPGSAAGPTPTPPPWTGTTVAVPALVAPAPGGPCPPESPAAAWPATLAGPLATLEAAGDRAGVSVTIGGVGTLTNGPGAVPLVPASTQKLLVAFAVYERLPLDDRLATLVVATGPVTDGVVAGDLVLVGGGDPTLTSTGSHSLAALAGQVRAAGITRVDGRVVLDESRHDTVRSLPDWVDGFWQSAAGALSAVIVDRNRNRPDPAFYADPGPGNLTSFADALVGAGVELSGATGREAAPPGVEVARLESPPVGELLADLLTNSNNLTAEVLLRELGRRGRGEGSTAAGLAVAGETLGAACLTLDGVDRDGSGLSRADARSPRSWRRLLDMARTRPWWPTFQASLAVAGRSGTLAGRLAAPPTGGNVTAKTGTTQVSRALSGYLTTRSGRPVTFSIVVNGLRPETEPAIDGFVTALAEL